MLVSRDKNPARKELPITIFQSTDEKAADVPMVANIACAVVLTALMDAALSHFKILFNIFSPKAFHLLIFELQNSHNRHSLNWLFGHFRCPKDP